MKRRDMLKSTVPAILAVSTTQAVAEEPSGEAFARVATRTKAETNQFSEHVNVIETLGRSQAGDGGGGRYLRTLTRVRGGFSDQAGQHFAPDRSEPLPAALFGAMGGDPSVDDHPGLTEAIQAAVEAGGGMIELAPDRTYYLSEALEIDPTRITLAARGATLSFVLKNFRDPDANEEIAPDLARADLGAPLSAGEPRQIKRRLRMEQYRRYRVVLEAFLPDARDAEQKAIRLALQSDAAENDGSSGVTRVLRPSIDAIRRGDRLTWIVEIDSPSTEPTLSLMPSGGIAVTRVSIKEVSDNACLRIVTPPGAPRRGHNHHELRGFKVEGSMVTQRLVDGIVFDTPVNAEQRGLHSRCQLYNVDVSTGIGRGLVFGRQTYLVNLFGSRIVCSESCVDTIESPSSVDAGENIAVFGGNLGGAKIGVRNRGMSLRFFSSSINFCRQWYRGNGMVEFVSPWMESKSYGAAEARTLDFADTHYRLDVQAGLAKIFGGYLQIGGNPDAPVFGDAFFRIGRNATLMLRDVTAYNWTNAGDVWAVGEGRLDCHSLRGDSRTAVPAIVKRDDVHNLFGAGGRFPAEMLEIDAWVSSPHSAAFALGPGTVEFRPVRRVDTVLTRGQSSIKATSSPEGVSPGNLVRGDGVPEGATVTHVEGATIGLSQNANGNGPQTLEFRLSPSGRLQLDVTADAQHRSLRLRKEGVGSGTPCFLHMAYPASAGDSTGCELFWRVDDPERRSAPVFFTAEFVALGETTSERVPRVRTKTHVAEAQREANAATNGFDRVVLQSRGGNAGYAPAWATHVLITCDVSALGPKSALRISAIHANCY